MKEQDETMADLILYGGPLSNFVRTARIACHEKGVAYDLESDFELGSPEHRARHPFGQIPAMRHGDVQVFETLGIATYVDRTFDGPALVPADALGAARTMQWVSAFNDFVVRHLGRAVIFERLAKPHFGMETDEARITDAMPQVERIMDVYAETLAAAPYFGSETATLADFFIIAQMFYAAICPDTEAMIAGKPAIVSWMDRMNERDSVQATVPPFG